MFKTKHFTQTACITLESQRKGIRNEKFNNAIYKSRNKHGSLTDNMNLKLAYCQIAVHIMVSLRGVTAPNLDIVIFATTRTSNLTIHIIFEVLYVRLL